MDTLVNTNLNRNNLVWTFIYTLKFQGSKTGFDGHQARLLKDCLSCIGRTADVTLQNKHLDYP